MTAAKACKEAGLKKGITELSEITGRSTRTLDNYFNYYKKLWSCILRGAVELKKDKDNEC